MLSATTYTTRLGTPEDEAAARLLGHVWVADR